MAAVIILGRASQRRMWATAKRPDDGVNHFKPSEEGLRVTCDAGHFVTHRRAFYDVIDAPKGSLLPTGPLNPVVIPASAFATPAEREAVRQGAEALIVRAR